MYSIRASVLYGVCCIQLRYIRTSSPKQAKRAQIFAEHVQAQVGSSLPKFAEGK